VQVHQNLIKLKSNLSKQVLISLPISIRQSISTPVVCGASLKARTSRVRALLTHHLDGMENDAGDDRCIASMHILCRSAAPSCRSAGDAAIRPCRNNFQLPDLSLLDVPAGRMMRTISIILALSALVAVQGVALRGAPPCLWLAVTAT
jgi:hypothetical protein